MTAAEFTAFYPQFAGFTPAAVLAEYVRQANARFSAFTAEDAEEARRLYTAHQLTLYARTALPDGAAPNKAAIAAAGQRRQEIASKKVGEVTVTYSSGTSSASARAESSDLAETPFGLQLLGLIRLYSRSVYVPYNTRSWFSRKSTGMFPRRPAGWFLFLRIRPIIQRKGQAHNRKQRKEKESREDIMESNIAFSVSEPEGKRKARERCLDYLSSHRVSVGLTSSATARSKALLAIHENGAPAMHIPARPVIRPALSREDTRAEMSAGMVKACAAAHQGDMEGTKSGLAEAGQAGADGIRAYIDKGVPPPNAPITLEGGWMRNPVSGEPVRVEGKSGTTPLVDTGQLYREFDWEIGEK